MRRNRPARFGAIAGAILLCGVAAAPAQATVTCTFTVGTGLVDVDVTGASEVVTIARSGSAIQVNGANCTTATVTNTDTIRVDGSDQSGQRAIIDLTGGAFAPGKSAEADTAEIEFDIRLGAGSSEEIRVTAGSTAANIVFGSSGAHLNSDSDRDLTYSGLDKLWLTGGAGADVLSAAGSAGVGDPLSKPTEMDGNDGNDTLSGGRGFDRLRGGLDASTPSVIGDTLRGGDAGDELRGGDGRDSLSGDAGGDYVDGDLGNDTVNGGTGNDYLGYYGSTAAPDGADTLAGGAGTDHLYYSDRIANVLITMDDVANDGSDSPAGGPVEEADNVKADIENITTGSGNDVINPNSTLSKMIDHSFNGQAGNDIINGGNLSDSLTGGTGNDTLSGYDGNDYLYGGADTDVLNGGEDNDSLYGDNGNDSVHGLGGDDYIDGGSQGNGPDRYTGGTGDDRITYGSRSDKIVVIPDNLANDGTDVDAVFGGEEGDNVAPDIEQLTLGSGNDHLNLTGTLANQAALDNTVYGNNGNDTILTGLGEDYIDAGNGNDSVNGGDGDDIAYGYGGTDTFTMNDGYYDIVDGGTEVDTGTFDAFDLQQNIP